MDSRANTAASSFNVSKGSSSANSYGCAKRPAGVFSASSARVRALADVRVSRAHHFDVESEHCSVEGTSTRMDGTKNGHPFVGGAEDLLSPRSGAEKPGVTFKVAPAGERAVRRQDGRARRLTRSPVQALVNGNGHSRRIFFHAMPDSVLRLARNWMGYDEIAGQPDGFKVFFFSPAPWTSVVYLLDP